MTDRTPPHDHAAERACLGAAMLAEHAARTVIADTAPGDFHDPAHGTIRATIGDLVSEGVVIPDSILVANRLAATGQLEGIGGPGVLATLMAETPATSNAATYARRVVEAACLRRLIHAGHEAIEAGYGGEADPQGAIDFAAAALADVDLPVSGAQPDPTILDVLMADDSYNWLLPDLMERGDRAIITAPEGMGKSTLLGQFAMQAAVGRVPFTNAVNTEGPLKVLVVDIENSERQIARRMRTLYRLPEVHVAINEHPNNLRFAWRMGLDLGTRADRRWLFERMEGNRPDLVVIGPIYKMMQGNPNDESTARVVTNVLDECRERWGISLLIEAHSPHGDGEKRTVRPFGASIWRRWPEFGVGLRPCGDDPGDLSRGEVVHWRGPREDRSGWPAFLHRNPDGRDGGWPWIASEWAGIRQPDAGDPGPVEPPMPGRPAGDPGF
jgi:hypothetical protein